MIHTWKDAKINLAIYYKRKNIFQNGVFQIQIESLYVPSSIS